MFAMKPERRDDGLRRQHDGFPGRLGPDLDLLDAVLAAQLDDLARGVQRDAEVAHLVDHRGVRPERVPTVHERDALGDRLQHVRPVEGAVAPAHDDDVLADVLVQPWDEVHESTVRPAVTRGQRPRRERADAAGDDDRLGLDGRPVLGRDGDRAFLGGLEGHRLMAEHVRRLERRRLLDECLDQDTALDGREARRRRRCPSRGTSP